MSFVDAAAYDRFMGRFSTRLAPMFADFAGVGLGMRVLDVGCGPGALTAELLRRADAVSAVDPSAAFVEALRERHPSVDVERGVAEQLPFGDGEFDTALAQLVVHFMSDPAQGLRELARVSRGVVAANVWDAAQAPFSPIWAAAADLDPDLGADERTGTQEGDLAALFRGAGLADVVETGLLVELPVATFEEWWAPFELGVGPVGEFVVGLDDDARAEVRERCRRLLPEPPFTFVARAWAARGCV